MELQVLHSQIQGRLGLGELLRQSHLILIKRFTAETRFNKYLMQLPSQFSMHFNFI